MFPGQKIFYSEIFLSAFEYITVFETLIRIPKFFCKTFLQMFLSYTEHLRWCNSYARSTGAIVPGNPAE